MDSSVLFEKLQDPVLYGSGTKQVDTIQTHISYVVLTGRDVYKIKKPVDFGFLDFSTLEKRKHFCHQEVELNRRLCPEIYHGVVPITIDDGTIKIDGDGIPIEYAVHMKQFPQDHIMTHQLDNGTITKVHLDEICDILIHFYDKQKTRPEIIQQGSLDSVKQNIDENFEQTKNMIGTTIAKEQWNEIKQANDFFFNHQKFVFKKRQDEKQIKDCHGDLHSGNIVIDDRICIFDCIEFNTRFRYIDIASDIGFLAMDLDVLNYPFLSSYFISQYVEKTGDTNLFSVLNLYKSYRAFVRGKVLGFTLQDPQVPQDKRQETITKAQRYFGLSSYYAKLFSLDARKHVPFVFMVFGITGTGKSTIAQKISVDYHAIILNTDIIRKQRAGIKQFEQHHDPFDTGLYNPEKRFATYTDLMVEAERHLKQDKNIILDATFQKKEYRQLVYDLIDKHDALLIPIWCSCSDKVAYERLTKRVQQKSVSDGRWEIYHKQKKLFDPISESKHCIFIDTGKEKYYDRMKSFHEIADYLHEVI